MTDSSLLLPIANLSDTPAAASLLRKTHHGYLWGLFALTILSGFLCFNRLSFPPLLIDECFTYWRVCGNLDQLLDTLRNDAFMPLHYELLNWIGQGFSLGFGVHLIPGGIMLTPTVMRFIPAICGTLMTPVMYFLARQMFSRSTALIAAAFITCSAYGLFFSRNAKMYAPAWMFETLMVACFLWWIRTWRRDAWLCWIFAGIAAGGFHSITLLLVPITPLYFISARRFSGWKVPMLVSGLVMILVAPAIYYGVCNSWTKNSGGIVPGVMVEPNADANWEASGLNWIEPADNSIRLPLTALNAYLCGLEWTGIDDLFDPSPNLRKYSAAMIALATATYGFLILGAVPWPHLQRIDVNQDRPQPGWRGLLWVALWLILPTYGFFYCRSVIHFDSPMDWATDFLQILGRLWLVAFAGIAVLAAGLNYWPRAAKFIAIPVLFFALAAVTQTARNHFEWMVFAGYPAIQVTIAILVPALLFHYGGNNFRERRRHLLQLITVFAAIFILCESAALLWRWLHEFALRKHPELPWKSIWQIRYVAIVMPAVWLAAAALIGRLPNRYLRVAAVLTICFYNVANGLAREYIQTTVPLDRAMADMFRSQPHSDFRTYFDLRLVTDNIYYRPLAAYNACIAARLKPTPTDFRTGYTWPFQWGQVAIEFKNSCVYNSSISSKKIHHDMVANPQVKRVIVWELSGRRVDSPAGDIVARGLGSGWTVVSDEQIISRWYWTWSDQWLFRRREFYRKT